MSWLRLSLWAYPSSHKTVPSVHEDYPQMIGLPNLALNKNVTKIEMTFLEPQQ